jgi:transcriptional regulator NrdR family protein
MPKQTKGGTEMHCPFCKQVSVCKGLPISEIEPADPTPRQEIDGIKYFKRYRQCLNCDVHFETAEVSQSLIFELYALRKLVSDLKEKIQSETEPYSRTYDRTPMKP